MLNVVRRYPVSFDMWKTFSKVLHKEDSTTLSLHRSCQQIRDPKSPLPVYVEPLTSKTFDFVSSLSITVGFPIADLVRLSKMTNLGVLEIVNPYGSPTYDPYVRPFSAIEDRVVRAWARAAADDGAFPILRILKLWNHPKLTGQSLEYLNCFPSLAVYDVSGCGFGLGSKIEARKYGWRPNINTNLLGVLDAVCEERAMLMQSSRGLRAEPLRRVPARQVFDGAKVRRMPRADIPKFLTRPEASLPGKSRYSFDPMDPIMIAAFFPEKLRELPRMHEWKPNQPYTATESWEFQTLAAFAKVGELRDDRDLAMAGIDIGDQPIVGDELMPPLPVASLRLGETIPALKCSPLSSTHQSFYNLVNNDVKHKYKAEDKLSKTDADPRTLSFIRIKLPSKEATTTGPTTLSNFPNGEKNAEPAKPRKRAGSGTMRSGKKRELANVLGSFLSG